MVTLIVSLMLAGGPDKAALPRDAIFSAIMIICNGVIGLCLLLGGVRHYEQTFRVEGATTALASIGLTIPAVALASVLIGMPLTLGLGGKDLVLLGLTFVVASITLVSGRTHIMQGVVHLVIFAAFLFLALVP